MSALRVNSGTEKQKTAAITLAIASSAFLLAMQLSRLQLFDRPASGQFALSSLSPGALRSSDDLQGIALRLVAPGRRPILLARCARSGSEGGLIERALVHFLLQPQLHKPITGLTLKSALDSPL
jgi:hypothetical protein